MKTCLITGASGFLGREVARELAQDWTVAGLGHQHAADGLRRVDLREREQVRGLVADTRPDAVVLLAAYRDPDFCEGNPAETARLNVDPVRYFAETLPAGVPLLFVSTDYVFDGRQPPYVETSPRNPISEYGRSKCAAEDVLASRPGSIVLRVPLLIGVAATYKASGFIPQMIDALRAGQPQEADDVLVRFPCAIRDVAAAIRFLLAGGHAGTFHLSGPRGGTRYAWTLETARVLGLSAAPFTPSKTVIPRKAGRPPNSQLDDTKLRRLGFTMATDPMDVVRDILRAYPTETGRT